MKVKAMQLAWIVVNDIQEAVKFYTETVGLKLETLNEEFGWAELTGTDGGARLGISEKKEKHSPIKPGQNAVLTFTVTNLEKAKSEALNKKVKPIGDVQEVPGHVKMQLFEDLDGNHFQLVQLLN